MAACSLRPAPEWPEVLADVRAKYPGVPQLATEELRTRLESGAPLLLDAREKFEFEASHLRGALWTPDESAALAVLAGHDRSTEVVVYCSVGMRSSALAEKLRARGYTGVVNLEGGLFAWANAGLPTFRGQERVDDVHPFDERWGTLLREDRRAR
jgi:rhodanese-related sulfurtransferase